MTERAEEVARAFYRGLARGELALDLLSDEIEWITPASLPWTPDGAEERNGIVAYQGMDQFGSYLQSLLEAVEGMRAEAEQIIAAGDHTVVVTGLERGSSLATGREFAAPFAHLLTIEGGNIVRLRGYVDTAMLRDAFTPSR